MLEYVIKLIGVFVLSVVIYAMPILATVGVCMRWPIYVVTMLIGVCMAEFIMLVLIIDKEDSE